MVELIFAAAFAGEMYPGDVVGADGAAGGNAGAGVGCPPHETGTSRSLRSGEEGTLL